jgi:NAD(P)-dependent dehydrogenase (short-subunit alcohol dehydrogenase family)
VVSSLRSRLSQSVKPDMPQIRNRLQDKVAFITGGGQGIGRATALLFALEGAKIGLIDKLEDAVSTVAEEISESGGNAIAFTGDVSRKLELTDAIDQTVSAFGGLDILVNNAGVALTRSFLDTTSDDIDVLVDVNLKGVIFASQAAIPHMMKSGGGAIVHDASNAGLVGRPWQPVYGATKAGIISLTKAMGVSLAKDKIRVNCICPGSIDTPMLRTALATSGNFEENWRRTEMVIPAGHVGKPEDIAHATLFLASDEASYITGVALPVDGGRTAGIAEVSHLGMSVDE